MPTQWFLCEILNAPDREEEELKNSNNLSVLYPDYFVSGLSGIIQGQRAIELNKQGEGDWFVWLPIIPRVGDTIQFAGWQVQVSRVILRADWNSKTGMQEDPVISAEIMIRDDTTLEFLEHSIIDEDDKVNTKRISGRWEKYARRGNDTQFFAWELHHSAFAKRSEGEKVYYEQLYTRTRPVVGDTLMIGKRSWTVTKIILTSPKHYADGILSIEEVA